MCCECGGEKVIWRSRRATPNTTTMVGVVVLVHKSNVGCDHLVIFRGVIFTTEVVEVLLLLIVSWKPETTKLKERTPGFWKLNTAKLQT